MTLKTLFKSKLGISATVIIILIAGWIINSKLNSKEIYDLADVKRGDIIEEIIVTGRITPVDKLDLTLERGGKISRVYVTEGDEVRPGQMLVELDSSELRASLEEAEANAKVQKAKLDELIRGARPENIQIAKTALLKAEQNLANEYGDVTQILNDAYAKTDDAVRNQLSALFINGDGTNPQFTFSISDPQAQIDAQSGRVGAGAELNAWKSELAALNLQSSASNLEAATERALSRLEKILFFLNRTMDAIMDSPSSVASTYRTSVTAARSAVNTAISDINGNIQNIASEKIAIEQAENELALQFAGSTQEDIHAQEAQLAQAEASVAVAQARISQTQLRSPITGVVSRMDGKVGEVITANDAVTTIISNLKLRVEADVPEVDIGKIQIGNHTSVVFDAFSQEIFEGSVIKIDPAEVVIDGVPTYKIKLLLAVDDPRIKPGMTANVSVEVARATNALLLPSRAIFEKDGRRYVSRKLPNGTIEDIMIELGIRGTNGEVEIRSGIQESDTVVIPERT